MLRHIIPVGTALFLLAFVAKAETTWHVDDDNCPGPGSGTVSDPFCAIQDAIDAAANTDTVLVAAGTYPEVIDFSGKAITLRSWGGPAGTTIDGTGLNDSVVKCVNGEGADSVLDGFTITGGTGDSSTGRTRGGGMYNAASSPTVTNCIFWDNSAEFGGGMSNDGSSPSVNACTFAANTADVVGGGMLNGPESNPPITDCLFQGNSAAVSGGGMHNAASSPTLINLVLSGNHTEGEGGGIYNEGSFAVITNCTLSENDAVLEGGGMHNAWGSDPTLTNCILWGNQDVGGTDESAQIQHSHSGTTTINCSCLEGWTGSLGGTGNIGGDPRFVDADGADNVSGTADDDLHLSADSACIDQGDNTVVTVTTDLDGNPRIADGDFDGTATVDMGAYEFLLLRRPLAAEDAHGTTLRLRDFAATTCTGDEQCPGTSRCLDEICYFGYQKYLAFVPVPQPVPGPFAFRVTHVNSGNRVFVGLPIAAPEDGRPPYVDVRTSLLRTTPLYLDDWGQTAIFVSGCWIIPSADEVHGGEVQEYEIQALAFGRDPLDEASY